MVGILRIVLVLSLIRQAVLYCLPTGLRPVSVRKSGSLCNPRTSQNTNVRLHKTVDTSTADNALMKRQIDQDFLKVGLPALVSLAAEPVSAIVDAIYVARLGAVAQAALGIAIGAQFSIAKLYNDPLLKTSTSIVAGKEGEELRVSVASAIATAIAIGILQSAVFLLFGSRILNIMGVRSSSEMMKPALSYLKWRSLGVPAATMILVSNGIFRGRGDTRTPLYCTLFGTLLNVILDPILIFTAGMGCAGAGLAATIAQWCAVVPMLYLLNSKVPIRILGRSREFFTTAVGSYLNAGGLLLLRTVSKIAIYSFTSAMAARLGTVTMAAYSLTFNVAFAGSQLCEAISIASQALIARNVPFNTESRREAARHVIQRSVTLGGVITTSLALLTLVFQKRILGTLTKSPDVAAAAAAVMPIVVATQVFKGLGYSTGGIILGGLDWAWSSLGAQLSAVLCLGLLLVLPPTLQNIWLGLAALMATQVVVAVYRFSSNQGPWQGLDLFRHRRRDHSADKVQS